MANRAQQVYLVPLVNRVLRMEVDPDHPEPLVLKDQQDLLVQRAQVVLKDPQAA